MKKEFLVVYDYGMGGVWAIVQARSAEEITTKFKDLEVVDPRPAFITDEALGVISEKMTFDIDHPAGWIAMMLRKNSD